jgi:methyl acetate hydrolase
MMPTSHQNMRLASTIAAAESVLDQAVAQGDLRLGLAMIASSEGILFQHAVGARDVEGQSPVDIDAIIAMASMTKLVTTVAALQLVEGGALSLDEPVNHYLPALERVQILVEFRGDEPVYKPAPRAPTARELITHTSGFVYPMWNATALKAQILGLTAGLAAGRASTNAPLSFAPGSRMEYGISTDWLGILVEQISGQTLLSYFQQHIFTPLKMVDTSYFLPLAKADRAVPIVLRTPDGLIESPIFQPKPSDETAEYFYSGGGGLYSTLSDYTRLLRALLRGGELEGQRILQTATVNSMFANQIGSLSVQTGTSVMPMLSNDFDMGFGSSAKWGLGFLLHTEGTAQGRNPGSGSWGGLFNSYFWIDPAQDLCGIFATQLLPFFDAQAVATLKALERIAYGQSEA